MSAADTQRTKRVKLSFPKKVLGDPIIHRLSNRMNVVPNILRGRITAKGAWLEVEIVGTPRNLERAMEFLAGQGVKVGEPEA